MAYEIANTIRKTLGGSALMMLGVKKVVGHKNGLSFKIGRNHRKINHIKITLNGMDLYEITFSRMPSPAMLAKGREPKVVSSFSGLYWDNLKPVIERETGMYTSL